MKLKIDFYADTFRSCEIEIPDFVKARTVETRNIVTMYIASLLYQSGILPPSGRNWQPERFLYEEAKTGPMRPVETGENYIKIITAKII